MGLVGFGWVGFGLFGWVWLGSDSDPFTCLVGFGFCDCWFARCGSQVAGTCFLDMTLAGVNQSCTLEQCSSTSSARIGRHQSVASGQLRVNAPWNCEESHPAHKGVSFAV